MVDSSKVGSIIKFSGKYPYGARPLRGAGAKNKRRYKKFVRMLCIRQTAVSFMSQWTLTMKKLFGVNGDQT